MNPQTQIVTSANWDTGRAGNKITGIVLHTMVGTVAGAYGRFNDPNSHVSVHYGIGLDGAVHQWVREQDTAWQAGDHQVNLTTIGIEHEDKGNYNDAIRTPQLYQSSAQLVADICRRYNIPCDFLHIRKHCDVIDKNTYPGGTACPDGLDTLKIISMAQSLLGGNMLNDGDFINILGDMGDAGKEFGITKETLDAQKDWNSLYYNVLAPFIRRFKFESPFNDGDDVNVSNTLGIPKDQLKGSTWNKVAYQHLLPAIVAAKQPTSPTTGPNPQDAADAASWRQLKQLLAK